MLSSLRTLLYDELTDYDVECISVILICHLLIERKMNELLYKWMSGPVPEMSRTDKVKENVLNQKVRNMISSNVGELKFSEKINIIKPLALALWDKSGEKIIKDLYAINSIRNDIFHRLQIKDLKFKNISINTEDGIEKFFEDVQHKLILLDDLIELFET